MGLGVPPQSPGELNYFITTACVEYWRESPRSYQRLNDIIGALEAAKLEFYRRIVVPFEEEKCYVNGDVY